MAESKTRSAFDYSGAKITIEYTGNGSLGADVHRDGVLLGRVAVCGEAGPDVLAEKLVRKAKELVDEKCSSCQADDVSSEPSAVPLQQ